MGSYFGVAYFTKELDWDTQSSFLMPFPLLLTMMAINWAWARDMQKIRPTVERWPSLRLSNWWIFGSAAAASYLASFLPDSLLEATVLTTILSVALWLAVVQLTRALLRERTRDQIAQACRLKFDDPVVRDLANNNDLANAGGRPAQRRLPAGRGLAGSPVPARRYSVVGGGVGHYCAPGFGLVVTAGIVFAGCWLAFCQAMRWGSIWIRVLSLRRWGGIRARRRRLSKK